MVGLTPPTVPPGMDYVVFDLDGTLARSTWPSPEIGDPIPEGIELLLHYVNLGYAVTLYTSRPRSHQGAIEKWLRAYNLHDKVYDIQTEKPLAGLYVDDRAYRPPWSEPVSPWCYGVSDPRTQEAGVNVVAVAPKIIGLAGHLQAGKDTVGYMLATTVGYQRLAFADALKALGRQIGWDGTKSPDGRRMLQVLGVAVREVLGEDAWIRVVRQKMVAADGDARFVITDVRFQNEAQMIWDYGGEIWVVRRPGFDGDGHISEQFANDVWADVVIENNGTLEDLSREVTRALDDGTA